MEERSPHVERMDWLTKLHQRIVRDPTKGFMDPSLILLFLYMLIDKLLMAFLIQLRW